MSRGAEAFSTVVERSPLRVYTVDSQSRIRNVSAGAMPAFRNVTPLIGRDFEEAIRSTWPEAFADEAISEQRLRTVTNTTRLTSSIT